VSYGSGLEWQWRWLACSSCTRSHRLCSSREMFTRAVPLVSEHWTSRPVSLYSLCPRLEYIPLEPILIKKNLFGHHKVRHPRCVYNKLDSNVYSCVRKIYKSQSSSFWACSPPPPPPPNCMKNFRARKFYTHFLFLAPISSANNALYHTTNYPRLLH